MPPLVSIIIPTYNRYNFLIEAIESIKNQTYKNFEIIIVDDGSIDKTCRLQSDKSVVYLKQNNKGPAAARNSGVNIAKGEWLAFLDSDDLWCREKLRLQMDFAKENPEYDIFYTDESWIKDGKYVNKKKSHKKYHDWIYPQCLKLCFVGISTLLIKKYLWKESAGMDEKMPVAEDYDLWLRLAAKKKFYYIDKELVIRNGGRDDQLSISFRGMDKYRIIALQKMMKVKNLKEKWREMTCNELIKKCKIYMTGCKKHGKIDEVIFCENILNRRFELQKN